MYDVIIIGAGLAGTTCGYLLKKQNQKVLIIEKEKLEYKDKLCGGLLTKKAYNLFYEIFEPNNDLNFEHHKNFIINNMNNKILIKHDFYSVYRKDLDNYTLNKYLNIGGEIIDNVNSYNLELESNTLTINNKKYQYKYLIGADGVFSNLRKLITGKIQNKNFAYEIVDNKKRNLEVYFFNKFKGYGWIIPNNRNSIIGVGDVSQNTKIDKNLNDFLDNINIEKNKLRGAFLPTGDDIYLNYKNVFFVGDSAGLISPIIGEGIYYALLSSKILSENIGKNYKSKCFNIIKQIIKERYFKKIIYKDSIRNYVFNHYNNILIKSAINHFADKHL